MFKANIQKKTCPDCGNAPVNHHMHKVSVVVDTGLMKLNSLAYPVQLLLEPALNKFLDRSIPHMFQFLARRGWGGILLEPDEHIGMRERVFWEEGVRLGIKLYAYRPFDGANTFTVAEHNGKTLVYDTIPRPGKVSSRGINWMDDKNMCHKIFGTHQIPMAQGRAVFSYAQARKLFSSLQKPVIVKPSRGSRSRHTTTHISDETELQSAFKKAKQLSPWVIVEEDLEGFVYRGTVIGGKVIGILRREPASVVGDGVRSIAELIMIENQNPKRQGPIFHTIDVHTPEHTKELQRQGMDFRSIPQKGTRVLLSQKASRGLGGGATDVTVDAHPAIIAMLEKVAYVLGDSLVGVDFIISDITKSWEEQPRSGVIECNSAPFIDLHLFPLVGKPRNTPRALWNLIFPELQEQK